MARVNFEECWWSDPRRSALIKRIGDEERADGVMAKAWRTAQEYWKHGGALVPKEIFGVLAFASDLLAVGLAVEREDGIYLRGSSQYLSWVAERRAAAKAGGKKSAAKRSKKPKQTPSKEEANLNQTEASANQTQASVSGSFSGSDSGSTSDSGELSEGREIRAADDVKAFIATYCEAFKTRYGTNPPITGKDAGTAKNLVKAMGTTRCQALVLTYLTMNDQFYLTRRHDLTTFQANLNAVAVKHDTGQGMTRAQAMNAERQDYHADQLRRVQEGTL